MTTIPMFQRDKKACAWNMGNKTTIFDDNSRIGYWRKV